jgi:AcrR family transcriptional regulator
MDAMGSRKVKARVKKESSSSNMADLAAALPHAAPTRRVIDDLAQTVEAPSAGPRLLLMDAAESVLAEIGFSATTGTEIARFAGVSLDVFQAHFASKTALLHAMIDRFCAQAITTTDEALRSEAATLPHELVAIAIRSILDVVLGRAPLVRAVLSHGDDKMIDGLRRFGAHVTMRVTHLLEEMDVGADSGAKLESRDVAFVLHSAAALAHQAAMGVTDWTGSGFDRDELCTRASQLAQAYLFERDESS